MHWEVDQTKIGVRPTMGPAMAVWISHMNCSVSALGRRANFSRPACTTTRSPRQTCETSAKPKNASKTCCCSAEILAAKHSTVKAKGGSLWRCLSQSCAHMDPIDLTRRRLLLCLRSQLIQWHRFLQVAIVQVHDICDAAYGDAERRGAPLKAIKRPNDL